jgi:hypothetical protein
VADPRLPGYAYYGYPYYGYPYYGYPYYGRACRATPTMAVLVLTIAAPG